ncbi:ABC transporter permease [Bacillus aquiflavi]|uniref:ABC transporter permease n=1 Tax=Bacillus aquiflavi TaxID=2672567 RepID=A0A6B3W3P5_9BACI|nr:FtsX-like permease family protein [Bacillus aquiflavi]MBA4537858.1 ABC transporter permease [Bacillus aquiflavi]NEY82114.1 ABC transporter permease [Bacillus aquiflavi]
MKSWQISWRNLMAKKLRSFLTIVAIILGVASVLISTSMVRTTQNTIEDATKQLDVVDFFFLSSSGSASEQWLEKMNNIDNVSTTVGILRQKIQLSNIDGEEAVNLSKKDQKQLAVDLIGVNDLQNKILHFDVIEGELKKPGITIDQATAQLWKVQIGDKVTFSQKDKEGSISNKMLEVTAIIKNTPHITSPVNWKNANDRAWQVYAPLEIVQQWTKMDGLIEEIQIKADEEANVESVQKEIKQLTAPEDNVYIQPAVTDKNQLVMGFEELYSAMYVIGGLSLLISAFILYNTLYISVAERKHEFAIMKTIGYTSRQVIGFILREVFLLGLVGSIFGIVIGTLLASSMQELLFQSFQVNVSYHIQWFESLIISFVAGIVIPLLAAIIPTLSASRTPVTSVLRSEPKIMRLSKDYLQLVIGIILLIPGMFVNHMISFLPLFLGLALLFPYIFRLTKWLISPINQLIFGREGKVTSKYVNRNIKHLAMASAILSFGITLFVFISSLSMAITNEREKMIRESIGGDIVINYSKNITPDKEKELFEIKGVKEIAAFYSELFPWKMNDGKRLLRITSVTKAQMEKFPFFTYRQDGEQKKLFNELQKPQTIVLGLFAYEEWGGKIGETITFETSAGLQKLKVIGVVNSSRQLGYEAFIHEENFHRDLGVNDKKNVLMLIDSTLVNNIKADLMREDGNDINGIKILAEEIEENKKQGEDLLMLLNSSVFLGMVVAGIGIMNTLFMNIAERKRELGTMRALGFTPWQMMKTLLSEAFFIGWSSSLIGTATGIFIMYLTVVLNTQSFILIEFVVSWKAVLWAFIFGMLISLISCLLPANRAAKIRVSQALKYE